eukprot:SAG31_NODE_1945_length_6853_cov_4.546491_2_plen_70_part_00
MLLFLESEPRAESAERPIPGEAQSWNAKSADEYDLVSRLLARPRAPPAQHPAAQGTLCSFRRHALRLQP